MPFVLFKKGDRRKFQTKEWQTSPERQCCHCLEFHRSWLPGISTIYDNPSHVSPQTRSSALQICWKCKNKKTIYDHPSCLPPSVVRIRCKNSSESRSPHQTWQVGLENDSHTNQEYFLHPLQKVDETQLVVDDKKLATCCRSASFCNLAPYPERPQDFYRCATSRLKLLCIALDGYFIRLHNSECGFESLR